MTDALKTSVSIFAFAVSSLLLVSEAWAKAETDQLKIYAGPQSVSPEDVIHVTVELVDIHGNSVDKKRVNLSYIADGVSKTLEGIVQNGLVSFDVAAQNSVGRMDFSAQAEGLISSTVPVRVVAAEPIVFKLSAKPSRAFGLVEFTSEIIVDAFGNPISDQNLVALSWVDSSGVKGTENTQLSDSRIFLDRSCPAKFIAPLRVRAVLKNTEVLSADLSSLCVDNEV